MSGCLDNAHCPQLEFPNLSEKRNQIASIVSGGLVNIFLVYKLSFFSSLAISECKVLI